MASKLLQGFLFFFFAFLSYLAILAGYPLSITGKNSTGSMGIILFIRPLALLWSGRWPFYTCYLHEHQYQCWSGIDFHSTGSRTDFWLVCSRNISRNEIAIKQENTWGYYPQRSLVPTRLVPGLAVPAWWGP